MIPKKIHYCWFGKGEKSKLINKCIESWKKFLPEYEIKEWNESNFDLEEFSYAKQAYENRKFAFVSDVVRLYALKSEGGIYLDTDVEFIKPLTEDILSQIAFSGFEDNNNVPTGIMGSVKNSEWISDLLEGYYERSFVSENGEIDTTTNVFFTTELMKQIDGFTLNNTLQIIPNYCTLYPSDYFCPKSWETLEINLTDNTYCIHHFAGSWKPEPVYSFGYKIANALLGRRNAKIAFDKYQNFKKIFR